LFEFFFEPLGMPRKPRKTAANYSPNPHFNPESDHNSPQNYSPESCP
jgi:hypothetical protein